jgi:molybdopterin/thiamine biosynthesis adenylyltransferase
MPSAPFDYSLAFSRNLGWVTEAEQKVISTRRVAIAGVGGVGGFHAQTLARLGIQHFSIADPDHFEIANFNRQAGAMMSTLNAPKVSVIGRSLHDINPAAEVRELLGGVGVDNVDAFLDGVDIYVDGLDFFAFDARRLVFAKCRERGIPVVTAAPIGMGTSVLVFTPDSMSAEDYFGFADAPREEWPLKFLIGLAPALLHRGYLVDKTRVNLAEQRGPSTAMACYLCAGVAATETLKLLLGRGDVAPAPRGFQFDAYTRKFARTWRPGGHKHPLQQLALMIARKQLRAND